MIYETSRFRERLKNDDATSKSHLLTHLLDISSSSVSTKNRNYLTEGKLGQISKELGILIRKERLSRKGRILFYQDERGTHLIDYDWTHSSVDFLESQSKPSLRNLITNDTPNPELDKWLQAAGRGNLESLRLSHGANRDTYAEELGDEWIRFLDAEQSLVRESLFIKLLEAESSGTHLILGGAGTGKTMVLLDLAWKLIHEAGLKVKLDLPEGVREYLAKSEESYWFQRANSGSIVLLDDPRSFDYMDSAIKSAKQNGQQIVVAIDPTQWTDKRTREKFWHFLSFKGHQIYELTTAYRQGGAIGKQSLQLLAGFYDNASMFADASKVAVDRAKAEYWENLCLRNVKHVDDLGFFVVHEIESEEDLRQKLTLELKGVLEFETYRRWPKLLVGAPDRLNLPIGSFELLSEFESQFNLRSQIRSFSEVLKIRGTEFESVVIFLERSSFQRICQGPTSLGGPDYQVLTQPLTFLTRAENRLAIFVLPRGFPTVSRG